MKYIIFILSLFIFCSCTSTMEVRERKAQKKLHKAIKLYPAIVGSLTTDTMLSGTAIGNVKDTMPGYTVQTGGFDCDSIKHLLDSLTAMNKAAGHDTGSSIPIYKDSNIEVDLNVDKYGNMSASATVKPKVKELTVSVPYTQHVQLKSKTITIREEYACWHYWWFWVMVAAIVLLINLLLNRR